MGWRRLVSCLSATKAACSFYLITDIYHISFFFLSCEETCNPRYAYFDCGDPAYPYNCQNPGYATLSVPNVTPQPTKQPTPMPTPLPVELLSDAEQAVVTITADADATISKGNPESNYGQGTILKVKGLASGPNAHDSIISFTIQPSPYTPREALLRLYSVKDSPQGGVVHLAPGTNWSDQFVTWNSAPDWGAKVGNIGQVNANQWYTMDVSEAVNNLVGVGGTIIIRIRGRATQIAEYSSKEGVHSPEIMLVYDELPSSSTNPPDPPTPSLPNYPVTKRPTPNPTPRPTKLTTTTVATVAAVPGQFILTPTDDATIVADNPDSNFGSDTSLEVDDDSGIYDFLLRFDVSDIDAGAVESAMLRLYCIDGSDSGGIFGRTQHSNWSEDTVTWSNAPQGVGAPLQHLGSVQKGTWYIIDVTDLFTKGNTNNMNAVSIRITSNSWNRAGYSSKEGSESPELVIQLAQEEMQQNMAEANPSTDFVCTADVRLCPGGSYVSRVAANGCNFGPCPSPTQSKADPGPAVTATDTVPCDNSLSTGLFYPVWREDGRVACVDDGAEPSWARGVYLKESKSACCKTYFMLQVEECMLSDC